MDGKQLPGRYTPMTMTFNVGYLTEEAMTSKVFDNNMLHLLVHYWIVLCNVGACTGGVEVRFYSEHRGHTCEVAHQRVSKERRMEIAGLLSFGVSFDDVLDRVLVEMCTDEVSPLDLISKRYLQNVQRDFGLDRGVAFAKSDADSVAAWVEQVRRDGRDPDQVRFVKFQGEPSPSGVHLAVEDFMLVIITRFQLSWLQKVGGEMKEVAMDSTHGTNEYNFQLTTLLVIDDHGEGVPGAFCYSNRIDEGAMVAFLGVCRDALGRPLSNVVLMTDGAESYSNAWNRVMGPPHAWLLCTWHVDRAWRKNLPRIRGDSSLKVKIYKTLRILLQTMDEEQFTSDLQQFVEFCATDPQLVDFGAYFQGEYAVYPQRWAYCYRLGLRVHHNMHLEAMHRVIKHVVMKGHKNKRLDKSIASLMRCLRHKVADRKLKLYRGKWMKHTGNINQKHDASLRMMESQCVCAVENRSYVVYGSNNEVYMVEQCESLPHPEPMCPLKCTACKICIHRFLCNCIDSSLRTTICKHVHLVVRLFDPQPISTDWPDVMYVDPLDHGEACVEVSTEDLGVEPAEPLSAAVEPSVPQPIAVVDEADILQSLATGLTAEAAFERMKDQVNNFLQLLPDNPYSLDVSAMNAIADQISRAAAYVTVLKSRPAVPRLPPSVSSEPANKQIECQRRFTSTQKKPGRKRASETLSKPTPDDVPIFVESRASNEEI